jgi:hypothetical protein
MTVPMTKKIYWKDYIKIKKNEEDAKKLKKSYWGDG